MAFRAICVVLLSSLAGTGCGTVTNLARSGSEGGKSPFGGVRQDVSCIQEARNGDVGFRRHPKSGSDQYPQAALVLFCAVDLPFSLIGDAVTWPYAAAYSFINQPVPTPAVTQVLAPPPAPQPAPEPTMPIPTPPVTPAAATSRSKTSP